MKQQILQAENNRLKSIIEELCGYLSELWSDDYINYEHIKMIRGVAC